MSRGKRRSTTHIARFSSAKSRTSRGWGGGPFAEPRKLMSLRVIRMVAIWLVLLGVSPFTAPFSTCDLSVPVGPSSGTAHSDLWLKPAQDSDKAPVLASLADLDAPLFAILGAPPTAPTAASRPPRTSILILRI